MWTDWTVEMVYRSRGECGSHSIDHSDAFMMRGFDDTFPSGHSFNTFLSIWSWSWWFMNRTFVAPLERIKLECIIHGSKYTWVRTIQSIWAREGLMGFWKGNVLNLFRMVPFKSINFICYDMYCGRLLRVRGAKEITNHDRLIGGGISGITATILCLPLDTVSLLNTQSLPIMCHDMRDQWSKS